MSPHKDTPPKSRFVFASRPKPAKVLDDRRPWKVVVVDDEDEVHTITQLVLKDLAFEGRRLRFLNARSATEARHMIAQHPDAAILLVDVVMETEHAGLDLIRHVREDLKNHLARIILRTGQPGQAPESEVIIRYDINDYREKTELTAQRLVTSVVTALRAFRDLQTIEASRRGLERIVCSSAALFEAKAIAPFADSVLRQVAFLVDLRDGTDAPPSFGFAAVRDRDDFRLVAATGPFANDIGRPLRSSVSEDILNRLDEACAAGRSLIEGNHFIGYFRATSGTENLVYVQAGAPLSDLDTGLLKVLSTNLAIAFDNVHLNREILETQAELINTLGEVVETRSQETGHHVYRVSACAQRLATLIGLEERAVELLGLAAPMHDLGKIGIPDAILNKPGRLTPEEFAVIKTHTVIGHTILRGSTRPALEAAAAVAHQHHERWDGTGYPQGIAGEAIHIFGRIVGLVDVFDALAHDRVYKKAWPLEEVIAHIRERRGKDFDPHLVDVFMANIGDFVDILNQSPNGPHGQP